MTRGRRPTFDWDRDAEALLRRFKTGLCERNCPGGLSSVWIAAWALCALAPGCGESTSTSSDGGSGACERWVLKSQVVNARDLGGLPLSGGGTIPCRLLLRGGDLGQVSGSGCTEFGSLGVKTVVDLRELTEQQSGPPPGCVTARARHVPAPLPKLLPDTPANYLALFKEKTAVAKVFETLGDDKNYPAYTHCVIGRDRASFISALVLLALGAGRQTVIDEFNLSAQAGVAVKQSCIEAVLDEVQRLGGIESYLASVGVTSAQLSLLRSRASNR